MKTAEEFKVDCSPITSTIFAGRVSKKGLWINKKDVTDTAPLAVAQHLMQLNESIQFEYQGKTFVLKVEEVTP